MRDSVASVMQGARLPSASSGASVRPVPKEAESRRVGEESLPLEADIHSCLCSGCSGGQPGFVRVFIDDREHSVCSLLDLERKMFLPIFWKL